MTRAKMAGGVTQVVEHKYRALCSSPMVQLKIKIETKHSNSVGLNLGFLIGLVPHFEHL
jgi:hypothetical protein